MKAYVTYVAVRAGEFDLPEHAEVIATDMQSIDSRINRPQPCGLWLLVREDDR